MHDAADAYVLPHIGQPRTHKFHNPTLCSLTNSVGLTRVHGQPHSARFVHLQRDNEWCSVTE